MNETLSQSRTLAAGPSSLQGVPPGGPATTATGLPHDIRGLLEPAPDYGAMALWGGLATCVAALILWAVIRFRRRRPAPAAGENPWQRLFAELRGMSFEDGELSEQQLRDGYYRMSLLLREAIELRTECRATDKTLQELRPDLRKRLPLRVEDVEAVIGFLEEADYVKFSGNAAEGQRAERARQQVITWCDFLRPQESANYPAAKFTTEGEGGSASRPEGRVW